MMTELTRYQSAVAHCPSLLLLFNTAGRCRINSPKVMLRRY